jgi:hypothetical protein
MAYSSQYSNYPSKKHDSFIQPQSPRSPAATYRYDAADHVPVMNSGRDSHYHYNDRYYDPRSSYSHNPPSRPNTPPSRRHRTRSFRRRRSWPPPPSVEDEAVSLAKELHPVLLDNGDEVVMRGTINQEPVLIDVDNRESRFVLVRDQDAHSSKQDKSERAGDRKRRPQEKDKAAPPALKVDVDENNIFDRREPSPYAYTRTLNTPSNQSSGEYFMSPEVLTPPSAAFPKSIPLREAIDPKLKQARQNTSSSYKNATRSDVSDDSDLDARQSAKLRAKRAEARASFTAGSDSPTDRRPENMRHHSEYSDRDERHSRRPPPPRSNGTNLTAQIPRSVPSESREQQDYRSNNTGSSTSSMSSRTLPRSIPMQSGDRLETAYSSRSSKHEYAGSAPTRAEPVWLQTPPASPNLSSRKRSDSSVSSQACSSRPGSRTNSRPSSPLASSVDLSQASNMLSRSQSYQNDRSSTYPLSMKERIARPTSKLTSSMRQESIEGLSAPRIDVQSPSPVRPPLPYPDDAPSVMMPSHETFQIGPVPSLQLPGHSRSYSASSNGSSTSYTSRSNISQKPEPRSSIAEPTPKPRLEPIQASSTSTTTKKETRSPTPSVPPLLPPCPRKEYSRNYDDWYTLEGNSDFDVCPSCLDEIIRPTQFRAYFKRAAPRSSSVRTRCDFGSPWTRLAWLLTLKSRRRDPDLIYALAAIIGSESECPGELEAMGNWYGVKDQYGSLLPGFTICQRDQRCLEALFPSLIGIFARLPSSGSVRPAAICSLRTNSRRFPIYLDHLVEIDDKARSQALTTPNLKPLVDLIRSHVYKPECTRDRLVLDRTWHYMPSFPSLTVCEECYDDTVWPAMKQNSELANRFNRMLMPLPPAYESSACSCQLYSPRMRRVWDRAVRYGDDEGFAYLTRKVMERKEMESNLRRKQNEINRLLDKSSNGYSHGVDREWLKKELKAIEQDWLDWE